MIKKFLLNLVGCGDYDTIKSQNLELTRLAHYDSLTNLANRSLFHTEADKIIDRSTEQKEPATLFLVDLDNFKQINDTHGHLAGNVVLQNVATRLSSIACGRSTLAKGINRIQEKCGSSIVARLGGDEFVMLFEHMDKHEAAIIAQQISQELKEPVLLNNLEVSISASVGASIFPWNASDIHSLLKTADMAMYAAKENGKDRFQFYRRTMSSKIERRIEAELAVREIIEKGNITLYYQPIVSTKTGDIVGAEALMRGKRLTEKFFDPAELIEAAENANLIIPLGTIILKSACSFARRCIDIIGDKCDAFISVNVSVPQLIQRGFVDLVKETLEETSLSPSNLVIEITETILMNDYEASCTALRELKQLGVRISIDDFGKGYSSLSYLQNMPIDKIKIDMSFIQSIGNDNKATEVVKGIIMMADALGMHTCAEGVETELQYQTLKAFGCEQVQGFLTYKSLSEEDFLDVLVNINP